MSGKIDLHIHSKYSPDADLTLDELIKSSDDLGMEIISVTDHNTVEFHRELSKGKSTKAYIIPGIEIDCCFKKRNFHMLGYNIDVFSSDFDNWQKEFTKSEMEVVPERIKKLQGLGFIIDDKEVYKRSGNMIPQEELMAEIILENIENHKHPQLAPYLPGGERSDMPLINFFWDFFSQGKPVHIPVQYLDINEAISLIKDNRGKTVLAHPGANFKENFDFVSDIIEHGIEGIEAISTYHSPELKEKYLQFAAKKKIMVTCGSDFHGRNKPLIKIGDVDGHKYREDILDFLLR